MISSVIFDLSEVLIPGLIGIEDRLEEITGKPRELIAKALGSYPYHEAGNNLEDLLTGKLTYGEYKSEFMKNVGLPNTFGDVFDQECLRMFESPYSHTKGLLERVSENCDLYLLSDHCESWARHILKQHDFFKHFKGTIWSYEIGATKKSNVPFTSIIKKYQLNPLECLFIDDNQINITIANKMGFNTIHFVGPETVPDIYRAIEISEQGTDIGC